MIAAVQSKTALACQAVYIVTWTPFRGPTHFPLSLFMIAQPLYVPVSYTAQHMLLHVCGVCSVCIVPRRGTVHVRVCLLCCLRGVICLLCFHSVCSCGLCGFIYDIFSLYTLLFSGL